MSLLTSFLFICRRTDVINVIFEAIFTFASVRREIASESMLLSSLALFRTTNILIDGYSAVVA